ncbi:hypothetical protein QUB80_11120 [Chlorogloeopsis sp. ULAP01]|uniref:hypothetical protein n=1 Tax=Chlorogloeopsis sp. ULAP01 TaxID=3056483 RepID=UPI0025AB5010|nr:hypothetical protein [Chlorogloeopsis sp. ULAP01]MDM9381255.1 hypothetical protein [Chlorogloeopsis sp. ULAP01]
MHHFLLSRFIPVIPGKKLNKIRGILPGLQSWRESLYSWLVFILSTLTATLIFTPLLPLFQLNYYQIISNYSQISSQILPYFAIFWLFLAAILYEIESLFKRQITLGNSVSIEPKNITQTASHEFKNEVISSEFSVTKVQTTDEVANTKQTLTQTPQKYSSVSKQLVTFILIPFLALWIYSYAKLPEIKQSISANFSLENLTTVASEKEPSKAKPKKPTDNYERAVNKAKRAAKLAQLAQSQDEWQKVVRNWDEAITLMKTVPYTSSNYSSAQQEIIQYQIHREFAQQYTLDGN